LTFVQNGSCPQMAKLTSVNDDSDGYHFPGSSGAPAAGDYGPAMTLNCSDVALAESNLQILYANSGIVASVPCQSTVTIKATDPGAIKGASPHDGIFTITRVNGDWTKPLYVAFSLTGSTAISGVDYTNISTGVYIPTSAGSVTVPIHPINPYPAGTAQFQTKLVLTLQTSAGY